MGLGEGSGFYEGDLGEREGGEEGCGNVVGMGGYEDVAEVGVCCVEGEIF